MKNSKNFRNITKSFMKKSTPNSHKIKDAEYYEAAKGNKYYDVYSDTDVLSKSNDMHNLMLKK